MVVKTHPVIRVGEMIGGLMDIKAVYYDQLDSRARLEIDLIVNALRYLRSDKLKSVKVLIP